MKKYKGYGWIIALVLCLLLAGCSGQSSADSQVTAENEAVTSADAGNAPTAQRQADLSGEVTSMVGNEVTLKLIEMPEMPQNNGDNTTPPADFQNMSDEERQALRDQRASGEGGGPSGSRPQMELTYTGETTTITIPAGMTISAGFGRQDSEIELSDIEAGAVLMVWFSDGDTSDSGTVESVRVMQQARSN